MLIFQTEHLAYIFASRTPTLTTRKCLLYSTLLYSPINLILMCQQVWHFRSHQHHCLSQIFFEDLALFLEYMGGGVGEENSIFTQYCGLACWMSSLE